MRAVQVERNGGPEVLTVREVDAPKPGPGELVVDVVAGGGNFIDVYQRTGLYPMQVPYTPGQEGAGTVSALGAGGRGVAVGDRGGWGDGGGGYAVHAGRPA